MPQVENDAVSDASADQAHGDDACNDSTEQETTGRLSRFQEVGPSTRNNASEDTDTAGASFSVGTQAAEDGLAAVSVSDANSAGSPLPPSESNNFTSAGAAEAEDVGQNQHIISSGHAAGGAYGTTANCYKDHGEESYAHTEVASAAVGVEGQSNVDDNATDVAVASVISDDNHWSPAVPSSDSNSNDHRLTRAQEDTADLNNRTTAAIRRSMRETPGAFHVMRRPTNAPRAADEEISGPDTNTTVISGSNGNSPDHADVEAEQEETSRSYAVSQPRRPRATTSPNLPTQSHPSIELAEAWVVEEGAAGAAVGPSAALSPSTLTQPAGHSNSASTGLSLDIDASVEPVIVVTVTATPLEERRWFKTPSGIALVLFLLGGIVALVVAFPARKNESTAAAATRPFDIVIPNMPQDVSDVLEFKYNKVVKGQPIAMAFSADLSVHASSRIDQYYGQLQVVQYNKTSSSWEIVAKYGEEEAKEQDAKDGQIGNSAGNDFGAWADISYDGRILAVGLPRDDPLDVPDAGSVRVMEMERDSDSLQTRWNLKAYGDSITGVDPFGWTGTTFSLTAGGSMIAVASPLASNSRGNIIVYKFGPDDANADSGAWAQIGQTIVGDTIGSALAFAKLSEDGTMLATGSMRHREQSGQLRIFRWDDAANLWVQLGSTMEGKAKARLGVFPHFSRDGRTVAFSQAGEPLRCHVYQWDEANKDWERLDDDGVFRDGYVCMDLSPDGTKVILCSTDEQRCTLNLLHSGREWHETQEFLQEHGFLPYFFEREGEGDKIAGFVAPIGHEEGYTIGFYNIN